MSEGEVNVARRRFLIGATSVVGGIGVVGAAVPFVRSWSPSAKARALGAPVRVDISKLRPGELLGPIPEWRGRPIFVVRRTDEAMEQLPDLAPVLADPDSNRDQQPDYAANIWRAREERKELSVLIGLCTHLGCSPAFHGRIEPQPFESDWRGGYFCACHGSKFDLSGRVYRGVPAPTNLEVPPYMFETDDIILIGQDEETG
ncbi:MAG: ubiquinol-cytochrome c reductase iron-sulfur subunit [Gammaproteobacteria bacterium]|nr:MAG: ubiquinol-cytochrome c reductase iron-sulfur subunit [Gammaproteobacteria bacterium]